MAALIRPRPGSLLDPFLPVLSRSCTWLSLGDADALLPQLLFILCSSPRGGEWEQTPWSSLYCSLVQKSTSCVMVLAVSRVLAGNRDGSCLLASARVRLWWKLLSAYTRMCACVLRLFVTPWTIACQGLCPRNSSGKNTGMGSHSLFQEIFLTLQPTQHLNLFSVHRMLLPSSVFLTHISSLFHRLLLWLNLQKERGASTDVWH